MTRAAREVLIAGVGMIPFAKPGASAPYDEMGSQAIERALTDAGIGYPLIEQAYAGFVFSESCAGQRVVYKAGMTGIPIINVNNNCSSGSTALFLARQAVETGAAECALAVGFEQMNPGALGTTRSDRISPLADFDAACAEMVDAELRDLPPALRYYSAAGLRHMEKYGTTLQDFAQVRAKASRHAANNPLAIFRKVMTTQDVLDAQVIWPGAMTRPMACPPSCGAAAAVLVSRDFAERHDLDPKVRIVAQAMTTDTPATFDARDMIHLVGSDVMARAARAVYEAAGVGPEDIRVIELHDCFAQNEVIAYEALGLCPEGSAAKLIADGDNTYGGRYVVNPSGGLLSKGHPLGATGLAQCYELTHQLRGTAEARQVDNVRYGLQHNMGLGGACVVTLYERV